MKGFLLAIWAIVRKDLRVEARTKQVATNAAVFALLVVLAFAFSFVQTATDPQLIGRGALWVAFVFAGTTGVTKTVGLENRNGALDGLLLAPIDWSAIYLGKVVSTTVFTVLVELVTLGASVVLLGYSVPGGRALPLVGVLSLAAFGFASVAVIVTTLVHRSPLDELVVPVLLVPLVVPVLLAGIELTRLVTVGGPTATWLQLLAAYSGILFLAGIATFDYLVEG